MPLSAVHGGKPSWSRGLVCCREGAGGRCGELAAVAGASGGELGVRAHDAGRSGGLRAGPLASHGAARDTQHREGHQRALQPDRPGEMRGSKTWTP